MVKNEIIGYKKFTDKKGDKRCIVEVVSVLTDFDRNHGAVGMKSEEVWIPEEFQDSFVPAVVGKILDCKYEVSGRYANIIGVAFK